MKIGDTVVRKSYGMDIAFKIIDVKPKENGDEFIIKGLNLRLIADAPEEDLEIVSDHCNTNKDIVFNKKIDKAIKKILASRNDMFRGDSDRSSKHHKNNFETKELTFGRPGRILHIDGDEEYLDACLTVYKQLGLDAVGKVIEESRQPLIVVDLVKDVKPDIIVLTGHDGILKEASDYGNLENYRNSKYFVKSVAALRNFQASYDELVIFAGACQSCYEKILDAGANFASSPSRVLIHCLDPVFICEKIAYTNIEKIVPVQEAVESTITGTKGIGGLQTRGKYREGYPKTQFI
ncbi:sporulation peptidase YabG [Clostridium oryzae]|uniref:Sporulation-specific protease YabG n=1 Tax=Clostridium oryzae TaxID=1450648 RepID=A0A1V4IU12_9CLOT|nr:sporulation peptidase YabG [Clostridium oryzae]OPJ63383.1 sporulation-specific protease YabG [Clostridium oryzae]